MNKAEWLEWRRQGIGGSDIAAIVGLNPWKGPCDVYLEKVMGTNVEESTAMEWGTRLEEPIARKYAEVKCVELAHAEPRVGAKDHYRATFDRISPSKPGLVEIKTAGRDDGWGLEGSDDIPANYHAQVTWYCGIGGFDAADVAVLFTASRRFAIYTVPFDEELFGLYCQQADHFWDSYVLPKVPPPPDGSEGASRLLATRFPRDIAPVMLPTVQMNELMEDLKIARDALDRYGTMEQTAINRIKSILGDHAGAHGPGYKVSWKAQKPSVRADWKSLAEELLQAMPDAARKELVARHSHELPAVRPFRPTWEE